MISLGPNCHPAYWLRKSGVNVVSYPFDWLLSRPEIGLSYVSLNIESEFSNWLNNIVINKRGHVVSSNYPHVEFFHHLHLNDIELGKAENEKLKRRAVRFLNSLDESNDYLYCYHLQKKFEVCDWDNLQRQIENFLSLAPLSKLHIYFMNNSSYSIDFKVIFDSMHRLSSRCFFYLYNRDVLIHKTWGDCPEFLLAYSNHLEI